MSDAPARASSNSDARASSASNAERTSAVATAAAAASAPKKFALPASNRTSLFNSKKDYESKRRAHLESQFQSSALYWRSARNLLNDAVLETDRARELVEARCHIDRLYAESMEAVARGDVDEQNKPMTGDAKATKKKKKVNKEREAYIQGQNGGMLQVNKDGLLESKVSPPLEQPHGDRSKRPARSEQLARRLMGRLERLLRSHCVCGAREPHILSVLHRITPIVNRPQR